MIAFTLRDVSDTLWSCFPSYIRKFVFTLGYAAAVSRDHFLRHFQQLLPLRILTDTYGLSPRV